MMESLMDKEVVRVHGMMNLLLSNRRPNHETIGNVYQNFTSIHKAAIAILQDIGTNPILMKKQIGILITFCRCSLNWIVMEDGTIKTSLATLLSDIELHLLVFLRECSSFQIPRSFSFSWIHDIVLRIKHEYFVVFLDHDHEAASTFSDRLMGVRVDWMLEFVDHVMDDLHGDMDEQTRILTEKLLLLRNYFDLAKDHISDEKELEKLSVSVQVVASKMACYSFFRSFFRNQFLDKMERVESDVRMRVLSAFVQVSVPLSTDDILRGYVECIQENLMELQKCVGVDPTNPMNDEFNILHFQLGLLLVHLLTYSGTEHEKLMDVKEQFQDLVKNIGSVIYSCFRNQTKERKTLSLFHLIEKADLITKEINSCLIFEERPKVSRIGFLIVLSENLKKLIESKSELMMQWKDQVGAFRDDLLLFRRKISDHMKDLDFEQTEILVEKTMFLRNYFLRLESEQIDGEEVQELLISIQVVAFKMTYNSLSKRYGELYWWKAYSDAKDYVDLHMRVRILKVFTLSLDSSAALMNELFPTEVNKGKAREPMEVSFLMRSLIKKCAVQDENPNNHTTPRFPASWGNKVISLICSCFTDRMDERGEMSIIRKLDPIEEETIAILYSVIFNRIGQESPKSHQLWYFSFLLGNLKELLGRESDTLITNEEGLFRMIHENLVIFRSFILKVTSGTINGEDDERICKCIMNAGYVLECILTKDYPVWCRSHLICEFMGHIELIKAAVIEKIAKAGQVSSQASVVPTSDAASKGPSRATSQALLVSTLPDVVVGFKVEKELIRERLAGFQKQLDVISIVGMPGLGKTTLARDIFEDSYTVSRFDVRAWCCVSQEYSKKDLFLTILGQIIQLRDTTRSMSETDLSVLVHKQLTGRRYLIVLDDIWEMDAFMELKNFFPDNNKGSRIMLTSRSKAIGLEAKHHSHPIELGLLTDEQSWDLLKCKVYPDKKFPTELLQVGKEIARKCKGLPLAVVVVAGLLAKSAQKQEVWEQVAENLSSYLACDSQPQFVAALELSYKLLPECLKPLFLYLGAFPEDKEIPTDKLIWLWIAEGFVQKTERRSLERQAEIHLMDLIDRSLIMVARRRWDGRVKACRIHDLLRDMCLAKAKEEKFMELIHAQQRLPHLIPYQRRVSIFLKSDNENTQNSSTSDLYKIHSRASITSPLYTLLLFNVYGYPSVSVLKLLRVLHSESTMGDEDLRDDMIKLVHLRYMSVRVSWESIPSSVSRLLNLETLVIKGVRGEIVVPDSIWKMVKLRHLHINDRATFSMSPFFDPSKLENLTTLSTPVLNSGKEKMFVKKVPNLEKLRCILMSGSNGMDSFVKLISLKAFYYGGMKFTGQLKLPLTLKKLSISKFRLKWSEISKFQELKSLEVLKLRSGAVDGEFWNIGYDDEFANIKLLKLENLNIKRWSACPENFPRLEKLAIERCKQLEEIPSELGEVNTLQNIEMLWCSDSAAKMANEIREEQASFSNDLLKVMANTEETSIPKKYKGKQRSSPFFVFVDYLFLAIFFCFLSFILYKMAGF